MVIIITGASHTGKTALAQKLLEKHQFPYLSLDHLKMGLIRSGNTKLTPLSDDTQLTAYLWPVACEMIKTAVENEQNLIVEGCYVPFDWYKDFTEEYLEHIRYYCLVMSQKYITEHFDDIIRYENIIEKRLFSECTPDELIKSNAYNAEKAEENGLNVILIDGKYDIQIET